ncbi:ribonuclease 3-like protein 2 [Chenopodium quinoa]|uniref:RNase III domain-containing protein n=1 Tax=Chenopodium quinoa TaxID=63459 RepID=A0A803LY42_CHEQI|nr:ribonuclease 3-like protein 2 [Chenopodium quinoa]
MSMSIPTPMSISGEEDPPKDTERCVSAVEGILNYKFRNKKLLEEALTHSSSTTTKSVSYQRLEFLGDAVLGLAVANSVFLDYPNVDEGILHLLRCANTNTEKLARVAVRIGLYRYVRRNSLLLDAKVREFALVAEAEDDTALNKGAVKAPKVLADIVESVIAAVYLDCDFDLKFLWQVVRGLLEPIVKLETLSVQPVAMLYELCQKEGKKVDIRHWRKGEKDICSIYVDAKLVATRTSDQENIAKLKAAKVALEKLNKSVNDMDIEYEVNEKYEIESAKQKLNDLCGKKKWSKATYRIEKEVGLGQEKKYICSVLIVTSDDEKLSVLGDEKSRIKEAEKSAASMMIYSLLESSHI